MRSDYREGTKLPDQKLKDDYGCLLEQHEVIATCAFRLALAVCEVTAMARCAAEAAVPADGGPRVRDQSLQELRARGACPRTRQT